jgi:hypothetical protein
VADLANKIEWELRLTSDEFLLVLKALGGRATTAEEKAATEALGDKLTSLRYKLHKQTSDEAAKHVENMLQKHKRQGGGNAA